MSRNLTKTDPASPLRLALRPREAAAALGICERSLWTLTKAKAIPSFKLGASTLYSIASLQRWLDEQTAAGDGAA